MMVDSSPKQVASSPGPVVYDLTKKIATHSAKKYARRELSEITTLVLHHSAHPSMDVYDIANFHVCEDYLQKEGAPGIAYHFIIDFEGRIVQTNSLDRISWHVSQNNDYTLGICVLGNFKKKKLPKKQQKGLNQLIELLKGKFPNLLIKKHSDFKRTACPSYEYKIADQH